MSEQIRVDLAHRSYDIHVGPRLLQESGSYIAPLLSTPRVIIVTDENAGRFHLHRLTGSLEQAGIASRSIVLPAGEGTKNFSAFEHLVEQILEQKPDRNTVLVALGGGVIGDITGFAASVVLRGIDFIQIPTTLLAQVDSAVGGKTAINSKFGKNLIGAFHQPKLVLADTSTLETLPEREIKSGYAEVLKYGLIDRIYLFRWLEENGQKVLEGDEKARTHAVAESCRAKAETVSADEREAGRRALLNFGHTFAHALEAETGYSSELLHGEAVAIGMALAMQFSVAMHLCPREDLERVHDHYSAVGLPASPLDVRKEWDVEALMDHFTRDKKAKEGRLTFVLSRGIGKAFVTQEVETDKLSAFLAHQCNAL